MNPAPCREHDWQPFREKEIPEETAPGWKMVIEICADCTRARGRLVGPWRESVVMPDGSIYVTGEAAAYTPKGRRQ